MYKTIVVALDGSEFADRALDHARRLAEEGDGKLEVVHVREIMLVMRGGPVTARPNEDELESKVRKQVEELSAAGIPVRLHAFSNFVGSPAQHIAEVAEDAGADLIAVGTRGLGVFAGMLLGSVTQRLLHVAPCAVLAVPPASRPALPRVPTDEEATREPRESEAAARETAVAGNRR